jgi:hypothetical protein
MQIGYWKNCIQSSKIHSMNKDESTLSHAIIHGTATVGGSWSKVHHFFTNKMTMIPSRQRLKFPLVYIFVHLEAVQHEHAAVQVACRETS